MLLANQIAVFFNIQYLKKQVNDKAYFWHADKHESSLQADTIIFRVHSQACTNYPKYEVCISLQDLQKNVGDEVNFFGCR